MERTTQRWEGTPSHNGPRVDGGFLNYQTPDNNHYGTESFVDSLVSLAEVWQDTVIANDSLDNRQTPLNINDMSLPNGGKFDIEGEFLDRASYHAYHRVGRDADIRTTRSFPIGNNRNGVLLKQTLVNGIDTGFRNLKFEEICKDKGANPTPAIHGTGNNEHYHIYFYPEN